MKRDHPLREARGSYCTRRLIVPVPIGTVIVFACGDLAFIRLPGKSPRLGALAHTLVVRATRKVGLDHELSSHG